jgi:hypothetical protein
MNRRIQNISELILQSKIHVLWHYGYVMLNWNWTISDLSKIHKKFLKIDFFQGLIS